MPETRTKSKKTTVVIAAYNEEPRISNVLKAVSNHPLVDEVIVVDDCSKDETSKVAASFGVKVLCNEKNLGKTLSVKRGIEAAKNDVIVLLDADLKGITHNDLARLIEPVLEGKVDWTLSLRANSWPWMRWIRMDWISGERVLRKELLDDPYIWSMPKIGFSLETLMNKSLLDHDTTFCSIFLKDLVTARKADKMGFWKGWLADMRMAFSIMKVLPLHRIIAQFLKMAYLSAEYRKRYNV
jgi:glycosyltransferase involved in cell wall biosynthesis